MDPRQMLEDERATVERVIAFVCRRHGLTGVDAEDFAQNVQMKLLDNDCSIVRQFRQDAKFSTYLTTVVERIYIDVCVHETGKWHASAEAQRSGPVAIDLERFLYRREMPREEAIARTLGQHPEATRSDVEALADRLPQKHRRQAPLPLEAAEEARAQEQADALAIADDNRRITAKAAAVIREHLAKLSSEDRLLLQLHFESNMQISQIARSLNVEQKPLYRRREQLLRDLRKALEEAGVQAADVAGLAGQIEDNVDFGLRKRRFGPSEDVGSAVAGQESSQ
jgi:RNA polymerase sigma factor (sigma-70 family)